MTDLLKSIDVIRGLPHNLISNNRYIIRFAQTNEDLEAAQRLRFKVFNLELGEGLEASYEEGLDSDKYDDQCHHLLVVERSSNKIIGTYRMQTYEVAKQEHGFYTGNEYDLSGLSKDVLENSVEVGRACIEKGHRNGRVLFLLWRGLAKYMVHTRSRYLFGCCSITSQDESEAWMVMKYLRTNNLLHPDFSVQTRPAYECSLTSTDPELAKNVDLPQLFRLYMDIGARVCSPPAIDREFKTIDYLVILDIETLDERTRTLFFK